MMEDMSIDYEVFDAVCLDPDRTMTRVRARPPSALPTPRWVCFTSAAGAGHRTRSSR